MIMNGFGRVKFQKDFLISSLREVANLIGSQSRNTVSFNEAAIFPGLGLEAEAQTLLSHAKDLSEGVFKVLVYGGFNNGKSTLLNALLRKKLLPTDILECTAIITKLVYGQNDQVEICIDRISSFITHEEFIREYKVDPLIKTQKYRDRFNNIQYAQIECDSQLCANGVCLIDAPGLGATYTRSIITNDYLKKVHAVILVLDATRLLEMNEQCFIRQQFMHGQANNVFFVVNKLNMLDNVQQEQVSTYVHTLLSPLFNEYLYKCRVFFVNAKEAERASLENPEDLRSLEQSQILAFERQLESFLTSDQRNNVALYEAANNLNGVIEMARETIANQKSLGQMSLQEIKLKEQTANLQLEVIQNKLNNVENIINRTSEIISIKLCSSLRQYIQEMKINWSKDAENLNLEALNPINVIHLALGNIFTDFPSNRSRIEESLEQELKGYFNNKMAVWSNNRVPTLISEDISLMHHELTGFLNEFKLELNKIYQDLYERTPDLGLGQMNNAQWVQLILALLLRDWGGLPSVFIEGGKFRPFLGRIIQEIGKFIVVALVGNILGVLATLIWEGWQLYKSFGEFKENMRDKLKNDLFKGIEEKFPQIERNLKTNVQTQFGELYNQLRTILIEQIESRRREFELARTQKENIYFSFEKENIRLDSIDSRLNEIYEEGLKKTSLNFVCTHCYYLNSKDNKFCMMCGKKLKLPK